MKYLESCHAIIVGIFLTFSVMGCSLPQADHPDGEPLGADGDDGGYADDGNSTHDGGGDWLEDGGLSDGDMGMPDDGQVDGNQEDGGQENGDQVDGDDAGTVTSLAPEPDFDGDGKTDLIFISADPSFPRRIALKSKGDGFETLCRSESESPCNIELGGFLQYENTRVLTGDYNGDGRTDLFISSGLASSPGRALLLSNGSSFDVVCQGAEDGACGTDSEAYMIHSQSRFLVGEFTGDKKSDILVISGEPSFERISLLSSLGQGFAPACVGQDVGTCGIVDLEMLRRPATKIITADFNGDALDDVLAVSCDGHTEQSVLYLAAPGDGFERVCSSDSEIPCGLSDLDCLGEGTGHLIPGDYDGDGKMDIFSVSGDPSTPSRKLLLSNGHGFSIACSGINDGACGTDSESYMQHDLTRFIPGDFDGDGRTDIMVLSGYDLFTRRILLLSDGDSFHIACVGFDDGDCGIAHMDELVEPDSRIGLGDFNGDGLDDLFVMSSLSAYRALLISTGDGFIPACDGDTDGSCGIDSEPYTRNPATRLFPRPHEQQSLVYYGFSLFSPTDMTGRLQSALTSSIDELRLDGPPGTVYITAPLSITHDHTTIRFSPSVVLQAKSGAYPGQGDSVLSAEALRDVRILGAAGAGIKMLKPEYHDGEHRMGVRFRGIVNGIISHLVISDTGGDGIYLGQSGVSGFGPNENILIDNVRCTNNSRQGLSIISASNVTVQNSTFELTSTEGAAAGGPWAGVDLEPNGPGELLENIVISDCVFSFNEGCGFLAYLGHLGAASAPISVTLNRCEYRSNEKYGICIGGAENNVRGSMEFHAGVISGNALGDMSIGAHPNLEIVLDVQ